MSEKNVYADAAGWIQKFGDKPAVNERDYNGGIVRDFTIKAVGGNKLVRISVFPEFDCVIPEDAFIAVEGKFTKREHEGNTYLNITASKLAVDGKTIRKSERTVSNQQTTDAGSSGSEDGPGF